MLPSDVEIIKRKINIRIPGYEHFVNFRDLTITQALNAHGTFEFFWRISAKLVTQPAEDFGHFRRYINADVIFSFYNPVTMRDVLFKGVITQLSVVNRDGAHAGYRVKGCSHTIALEDLCCSRQFLDTTLTDIFKESLNGMSFDMWDPDNIQPRFQQRIAHSLQSEENSWQYLTRLAANYGEWLYWDGMRLQLGRLRDAKITLINGSHLKSFELRSALVSNKSALSIFDVMSGTVFKSSQDRTTEIFKDTLVNTSLEAQGNQYPRKATNGLPYHQYASNATSAQDVERMNQLYTSGKAVGMARYTAVSQIPVNVGHLVTVHDRGVDHPLIVIDSSIASVGIGNMTCEFVGIPIDSQYPPYTNPNLHGHAQSQPAIVRDNNDPEGLGRVKVLYTWGNKDNESPWLRIGSPHAGADHGFYFIPETGDEVRVSYDGGNPDSAYISGAYFNGKAKSPYVDIKNQRKALYTRQGHVIEFDERSESLSITIKDKSGNTLQLDTKGKSITITTPETLTLNARNMIFNADENLAIHAGKGALINVQEDLTTRVGKKIKTVAQDDVSLISAKRMLIGSGGNTEVSAGKDLDLYGKTRIIGYTDGKAEFGAKERMHVYGQESMITAKNKIEYKAPKMNKLAEGGKFKFNKEKQIVNVAWMDAKMEKEIDMASVGDKVSLLAQTRNYAEGETIVVVVDDPKGKDIREGIKELTLSGTVKGDGTVELKEQVEIGRMKSKPENESDPATRKPRFSVYLRDE
jgi:uncharacterized protein involved in type VI secretion and phage assembly